MRAIFAIHDVDFGTDPIRRSIMMRDNPAEEVQMARKERRGFSDGYKVGSGRAAAR